MKPKNVSFTPWPPLDYILQTDSTGDVRQLQRTGVLAQPISASAALSTY